MFFALIIVIYLNYCKNARATLNPYQNKYNANSLTSSLESVMLQKGTY